MYRAVNKNTVQQCITKVMADVIKNMYLKNAKNSLYHLFTGEDNKLVFC